MTNQVSVELMQQRLADVRAAMKRDSLDALVVRATDEYLNEYVSDERSSRVWLTGFRGSMGDAVVLADRAFIIVDGRYELQVKAEAPLFDSRVTTLGVSIENGWLNLLRDVCAGKRVGMETDRMSVSLLRTVEARASSDGYTVVAAPSAVAKVRAHTSTDLGRVFVVPTALSGRTVVERLREGFASPIAANGRQADALLLCALDELAWVSNLRGDAFAFQATFPGHGLATATTIDLVSPLSLAGAESAVVPTPDIGAALAALQQRLGRKPIIAIDPSTTPASVAARMKDMDVEVIEASSPFAKMRTIKTKAELDHMIKAFARADAVVDGVQKTVTRMMKKKQVVTEAIVAQLTEAGFRASGAWGLSFNVISAAGKNGAFIHYGSPDATTPLKAGDLFLLDTGAYYEGGYATDLTRTFLLGPATQKARAEQRKLYTLVLKGAIAGMSARLPTTATGGQLDAMVRAPIWAGGYDYGHGTGHGVGVNVHESPPRISIGSTVPIEPGQVFSIEPGVYLEGWGGIRIENLCTLVAEPVVKRKKGMPGYDGRRFTRVQPLTFSPLDQRLIDKTMLTNHEKKFLSWFKRKNPRILPPLAVYM